MAVMLEDVRQLLEVLMCFLAGLELLERRRDVICYPVTRIIALL